MAQSKALDLLGASGPFADYADKLQLYGQLVGSWDIEATWFLQDGSTHKGRGEWHFAWILGGRGVQDVLFSKGAACDRYGTTLRCYDPAADAWQVTWMQPYGGEFVHLTGRRVGERIVQEGRGTDPSRLERWSFSEITPDSFLWQGEVSFDQGASWILEQEMRGTRIKVG